jgi:hypothetical protein
VSGESIVRLFNASNGALLRSIEYRDAGIAAVAFSPGGRALVTVPSLRGAPQVWDTQTGRLRFELKGAMP